MSDNTEVTYDFDQFEHIIPDGIEVQHQPNRRLVLGDDETITLALAVLDSKFHQDHLFDWVIDKLNHRDLDRVREGLFSVRGFEQRMDREMAELNQLADITTDQVEEPVAIETTPIVESELESKAKPLSNEQQHARSVLDQRNRALSADVGEIPEDIKALLATGNVAKMEHGLFGWKFWATGRHNLRKQATEHAKHLDEVKAGFEAEIADLKEQIMQLVTEKAALEANASATGVDHIVLQARAGIQRARARAKHVVAAAREGIDKPSEPEPSIDTPHLVSVPEAS